MIVAFTDMQGRLQGKRLHAQYFLDDVLAHGTEGCNYLLAVDVDMNTVPGYAISSWDTGYGDMVFDLDLDTIRLLPWLPGTALVQCDLSGMDGTPVAAVPADGAQATGRTGRRRGLLGVCGNGAGVHPLRGQLRERLGQKLCRPDPGQSVQRRLLRARYQPGRAAAARHPQRHVRRRDDGRVGEGRVQLRPARDRLPLRRCAGHGRQPRGLQERGQGDRRPARRVADLHGEVRRAGGQLLPHPPLAARHRRRPGVRRRPARIAPVPPLRRRHPRHAARVHPAVRAEHQLLQALCRRVVRADHRRLGSGQPHLRHPAGRSRRRFPAGEPRSRR